MNATVIDTLKFADRLKKSGFEPQQAEGLARAFGDELAERMVTKRDLDDAVRAINTTLMAMDAKFESKFDALEPRFDAQHGEFFSRFDALEPRFDAIDVKLESLHREFSGGFDALEPRFDGQHREFSSRFDALEPRFDAIDVKLESLHREFSGKFNLLFGTIALGFTLIIGLIGYSLFSPRPAEPLASAVERHTAEVRLP